MKDIGLGRRLNDIYDAISAATQTRDPRLAEFQKTRDEITLEVAANKKEIKDAKARVKLLEASRSTW